MLAVCGSLIQHNIHKFPVKTTTTTHRAAAVSWTFVSSQVSLQTNRQTEIQSESDHCSQPGTQQSQSESHSDIIILSIIIIRIELMYNEYDINY